MLRRRVENDRWTDLQSPKLRLASGSIIACEESLASRGNDLRKRRARSSRMMATAFAQARRLI
jgi:hypothetical protein